MTRRTFLLGSLLLGGLAHAQTPGELRSSLSGLQPQALAAKLTPEDIQQVQGLLALYRQRRPRKPQGGSRAAQTLLLALTNKAYEVALRGEATGKRPSKESVQKSLSTLATSRALSRQAEVAVEKLVATAPPKADTSQARASKKGKSGGKNSGDSSVTEQASEVASAAAASATETATVLVNATVAAVQWLFS